MYSNRMFLEKWRIEEDRSLCKIYGPQYSIHCPEIHFPVKKLNAASRHERKSTRWPQGDGDKGLTVNKTVRDPADEEKTTCTLQGFRFSVETSRRFWKI